VSLCISFLPQGWRGKRGCVLINPPGFHDIFTNILKFWWLYLLPSPLNSRRVKAGVSRFFDVLRHIRTEWRQFWGDD
jgi:hypothetical protein